MRVIEQGEIPAGVALADFKRSVHIAAEDLEDDAALALLLEAAEATVASATGRPLTPRSVEFIVTRGSWTRWWFPVLPVADLTALAISDGAGGWLEQPLEGAWLQQSHDEPQLVIGGDWAGRAISGDLLRVQATVGGADAPTLARLRQAIFLLAKEWFEAGIAVDGEQPPQLSFGVRLLMKQARYRRPCEVA
ncbi:MAG: phage gp6-like head-tail connector protein [Epibacterium sp.]